MDLHWDKYTLYARYFPAAFLLAPIALSFVPSFSDSTPLWKIITLLGSLYLLLVIASEHIREKGLQIQDDIFKKQMPLQKILAYMDLENYSTNEVNKAIIAYSKIRNIDIQIDELALSTEESRSALAKQIASFIVQQVSEDNKKYSIIYHENSVYGQRRNLRGIKYYGIVSCIIGTGILFLGPDVFTISTKITLGITFVFLTIWIFLVTDSWVIKAAEKYAKYTFRALQHLQ